MHTMHRMWRQTSKQLKNVIFLLLSVRLSLHFFVFPFRPNCRTLLALGAQLVFDAIGLANFFLVRLAQYQVY